MLNFRVFAATEERATLYRAWRIILQKDIFFVFDTRDPNNGILESIDPSRKFAAKVGDMRNQFEKSPDRMQNIIIYTGTFSLITANIFYFFYY